MLLLALLLACRCGRDTDAPEMTLAQATDKAIYATVEALGPHRFLATIGRTDFRQGVETASRQETIEVAWDTWDRFRVARTINGQRSTELVVLRGKPWMRQGDGPWERREDVEPHRVQLQRTWDTWDEALDAFDGRIALKEVAREMVEGRWARRFEVSLAPAPAKAERPRGGVEPIGLRGVVWVDEATAVRLVASVDGEVSQGELLRRTTLQFARTEFGKRPRIALSGRRTRGKKAKAG